MSDDNRNITDEKVRESILGLDTMNKLRYGSFQKWEEYIKKYNVDEWMDI